MAVSVSTIAFVIRWHSAFQNIDGFRACMLALDEMEHESVAPQFRENRAWGY